MSIRCKRGLRFHYNRHGTITNITTTTTSCNCLKRWKMNSDDDNKRFTGNFNNVFSTHPMKIPRNVFISTISTPKPSVSFLYRTRDGIYFSFITTRRFVINKRRFHCWRLKKAFQSHASEKQFFFLCNNAFWTKCQRACYKCNWRFIYLKSIVVEKLTDATP